MAGTPRIRPVVLAAPSGAGKTTIARRLVGGGPEFVFSVSATTRSPRPGERDGTDYIFTDESGFRGMIDRNELAEWAQVHGCLYGTPVRNLEAAAGAGVYPVLDIDVQGARQIRARVPDALLLFLLPPDPATWLSRLRGRGTEEPAQLLTRLVSATRELDEVDRFDAVVVNDELDEAVEQVRGVVLEGLPGLEADVVAQRVAALKEGLGAAMAEVRATRERARR